MKTLSVSETRRNLPSLLTRVEKGREEIAITRHGSVVAKLVPCEAGSEDSSNHPLRGVPLRIAPDFDVPLDGFWEALEG